MKKICLLLSMCMLFMILVSGCNISNVSNSKTPSSQSDTSVNNSTSVDEKPYFNKEGFPIVDEKITVHLLCSQAADQGDFDNMYYFRYMEQLTNIHMDIETVPEENASNRFNILIASDNIPDITAGIGISQSDETSGKFLGLKNLIYEYAPNIKKAYDEWEAWQNITAPDGEIYGLVSLNNDALPGQRTFINIAWLENVGLEKPTNLDELYDVLKAFKTQDPNKNGKDDTIPMTTYKGAYMSPLKTIIGAYGYIGEASQNSLHMKYDKTPAYFPIEPCYKDYLTYCHKLYTEDLLDKEAFTQNVQEHDAKYAERIVGVVSLAAADAEEPERYSVYDWLTPMTSEYNSKKIWDRAPVIGPMNLFVSAKVKYPEAVIRWLDYSFTPEGGLLYTFGPEKGKSQFGEEYDGWEVKDTGYVGQVTPPEFDGNNWAFRRAKISPGIIPYRAPIEYFARRAPDQRRWAITCEKEVYPYKMSVFPRVYISDDDASKLTLLYTDISAYVEEMSIKFIMGEEPLSNFEKFIQTLKGMGVDEYVKILVDAYNLNS